MRILFRSCIFSGAIFSWMLVAGPSASFAGGLAEGAGTTAAPASVPPAGVARRPDVERKVWTSEDVRALGAPYRETASSNAGADASAATSNQVPVIQDVTPPALEPALAAAPLGQEQDPQWYAQQVAALDERLASIDSEAQRLRNFQATSTGLQTGLILNAPCDGITTDHLLAQLDTRRLQILDQIDELSDTARRNGMAPGVLTQASVETEAPVNADGQKAALAREYQERSNELARTRQIVQDMRSEAAAQNITLLQQSPGEGGNMTTDLLERIDARAQELQSQINTVEGDARNAGVEPGALR